MTKAAHPGGMQELASALTDDQHRQAYADPGAAQDPTTQQKGGDIVASIFGNNAIVQQVIQQAAAYTGIPAATLQQMLPVIVSLVVGGIATAMHNQNLGGVLGQLASGLSGLFGQAGGVPGQAGTGGFGGMLGNILGGFIGGASGATPQTPGTPPGAAPSGTAPPGFPPAMQAGMEALGKMFQPGVAPSPGHPADLGDQISSILSGKRG
jgi:hypothetical protein